MKQYVWILALFVIVTNVESRIIVKRGAEIDPVQDEIDEGDSARDKRKVDVAVGVKNAVLGFVFNKNPISSGFALPTTTTTTTTVRTTPKRPTTTEDIVIFNKDERVSLEVPDQLFGSSFTLITNLSTTVGDFMINSALRAQRLLESMRPFLIAVFGKKGFVIEATTDKPIFSAPENSL